MLADIVQMELRLSVAKSKMGYLWSSFDIFFQILIFYLFMRFAGRASPLGTDSLLFLLSGFCVQVMFSKAAMAPFNSSLSIESAPFFRRISANEILVARCIYELLFAIFGIFFVFTAKYFYDDATQLCDLGRYAAGLLLAWILGASFGYVAYYLARLMPKLKAILPYIRQAMFWTSGVFYAASEISIQYVGWLALNPVLNVVEFAREGVYCGYVSPAVHLDYVGGFILACLLFGKMAETVLYRRTA